MREERQTFWMKTEITYAPLLFAGMRLLLLSTKPTLPFNYHYQYYYHH